MFYDPDYFEVEELDIIDFGFTYTLSEEKKVQKNPIGFFWKEDSNIILLQKQGVRNEN